MANVNNRVGQLIGDPSINYAADLSVNYIDTVKNSGEGTQVIYKATDGINQGDLLYLTLKLPKAGINTNVYIYFTDGDRLETSNSSILVQNYYLLKKEGESDTSTVTIDCGFIASAAQSYFIVYYAAKEIAEQDVNMGQGDLVVKKITTSILTGNFKRIGIQASSDFLFFINGEPLKVGRSGFFETPDNFVITSIGFSSPNFICDYIILQE